MFFEDGKRADDLPFAPAIEPVQVISLMNLETSSSTNLIKKITIIENGQAAS